MPQNKKEDAADKRPLAPISVNTLVYSAIIPLQAAHVNEDCVVNLVQVSSQRGQIFYIEWTNVFKSPFFTLTFKHSGSNMHTKIPRSGIQ